MHKFNLILVFFFVNIKHLLLKENLKIIYFLKWKIKIYLPGQPKQIFQFLKWLYEYFRRHSQQN